MKEAKGNIGLDETKDEERPPPVMKVLSGLYCLLVVAVYAAITANNIANSKEHHHAKIEVMWRPAIVWRWCVSPGGRHAVLHAPGVLHLPPHPPVPPHQAPPVHPPNQVSWPSSWHILLLRESSPSSSPQGPPPPQGVLLLQGPPPPPPPGPTGASSCARAG